MKTWGHRLNAIETNLKMLTDYLNETLGITIRLCQKCDHETVQKVLKRTPSIYKCLSCGTVWTPRVPDEQVTEDEIIHKETGFNTKKLSTED